MRKNILFSALGGSLFPYLHYKLSDKYNLYYVDSNVSLQRVYPNLNFFVSPFVGEPSYPEFIKNIINKYSIHYYVPLIDEELQIAKNRIEGINNVVVISPTKEFVSLCLNKYNLMQKLCALGISCVDSFIGSDFNWEIDLPLFIKPIQGRGSRGIRKIDTKQQLEAYFQLEPYSPEQILIQPVLEGTEYTVGVTTTNNNDILSISSKRVITKKGITQLAVSENNIYIEKVAKQIVEALNPCGPMNIQLIQLPDNSIKIFEINPRFSTTTIMEYEGGMDLISLYIDNYNIPYRGNIKRPKSGLTLYRRWENLFYYDK